MNQTAFYEAKLRYETDAWDLSEMISRQEHIVIVDTRAPEAYEREHIPTAVNIPHRSISEESTRTLDRSKTYITYCDGIGCNASTKGALKLTKLNFTVKELLGGLDWRKRDGHATEGKEAAVASGISCGC